jgi:lipopolysaccharide export system protein LptA
MNRILFVAFALSLAPVAVAAPKAADPKGSEVSILPGGSSKEPISIEADKLDYFEKEGRAIYDGHVVVVQGDTHLTCSTLTIFMEKAAPATTVASASDSGPATSDAAASSKLKHMDCAGPVKVVSKTQTATADSGTYDKGRNNVILTGHVVLTDGGNTTQGDRLVYNLTTGEATVQSGVVQGGKKRVTGVFEPASKDSPAAAKKK